MRYEAVTLKDAVHLQENSVAAKIVSVFNHKGGVGKTLISMLVAGELARRGLKVMVIDMDSQGDAVAWLPNAPEAKPFPATVISLASLGEKFVKALAQHASEYDVIVVDCPPSDASSVPFAALVVSDLAVIPVQPTPQERESVHRALKVVEDAEARNSALQWGIVINRFDKRRSVHPIMVAAIKEVTQVSPLATLSERTPYQEVMLYGGTMRDLPRAKNAVEEVDLLVNEIYKKLEK
ncbi:MAG: ParA family protein [Rhodocyclaceae bacterium]|nr:ParA family protein [Rhodocyclaceae bacterium]MCA3028736.1 ParA family protein [Rhodocyclaceae bacterium]MCA3032855.1 ParA family protein [Rhodocyclaceae bacterium]MCA3037295.1 ParA family protein [Rhodocyclaceae bacterium]MCA3046364.1 ParA family protein [Rhodocyclaceae bacterium]